MKTCTEITRIPSHLMRTLVALALVASFLVMVSSTPAHALTTFTVTTIGDEADGNLGNGICDVELKATQCTLRGAIQEANFEPGADVIEFNIGGSGVKTISPNSELPDITEQASIDGYSQPGASPNSLVVGDDAAIKIELKGTDAGSSGLTIKASNVGIRGLAINRFATSGISIEGGLGARIEGNFIGTDPTGLQDLGNRSAGVDINGASGSGANTIGGDEPAERNLISGNDSEGVFIFNGSLANSLLGNYIGTKKDGTTALGNGTHGVDVQSGSNIVGGSTRTSANTIAFNGDRGVQVGFIGISPSGNSILRNSIFSNGGPGIDLQADGPTANDPGDSDTGPNNLQNKPVISSAKKITSTKTTIEGKLNSKPNKTFKVQFYSNPKGTGEGKTFLFSRTVSTHGSGNATFSFVTTKRVVLGQAITATATGADGTSEFSAAKGVVAG